ncbi:MAG: hypothetical protein VYC34_06725 [Planctomycetota bacterium]|nr:hypothetical protein [Planctomycetota bacterium]
MKNIWWWSILLMLVVGLALGWLTLDAKGFSLLLFGSIVAIVFGGVPVWLGVMSRRKHEEQRLAASARTAAFRERQQAEIAARQEAEEREGGEARM